MHSEGVEVEPDEALLSNIHELLAKRLQAKFDRKFDDADACKAKLEGLGVRIFDKNREWSYKPFVKADYGPLGHDYSRASDDEAELDEAALAQINELLATRLEAKLKMQYDEADRCKEVLSEEFNVFVNDKFKGWRADGGLFPTHVRVEGDGDTESGDAVDEALVEEMLKERSLARKEGDYAEADRIKANLLEVMRVALDDKAGTWRVVRLSGGSTASVHASTTTQRRSCMRSSSGARSARRR